MNLFTVLGHLIEHSNAPDRLKTDLHTEVERMAHEAAVTVADDTAAAPADDQASAAPAAPAGTEA